MAVCVWCEGQFAPAGIGRRPRFCSDRCRKAQHQRVRTLKAQYERYVRLCNANAEPYRSYYAVKAADAADALADAQLAALPQAS